MNPCDDNSTRDNWYNNSCEEEESVGEDDDIVYMEEDGKSDDVTRSLHWTTSISSQLFNDDREGTLISARYHSQSSLSRGGVQCLPATLTRQERRVLKRQQIEVQKIDGHEDSDSCANEEDPTEVEVDESGVGVDIFASVEAYFDQKDDGKGGTLSQLSEGGGQKNSSRGVNNEVEVNGEHDRSFCDRGSLNTFALSLNIPISEAMMSQRTGAAKGVACNGKNVISTPIMNTVNNGLLQERECTANAAAYDLTKCLIPPQRLLAKESQSKEEASMEEQQLQSDFENKDNKSFTEKIFFHDLSQSQKEERAHHQNNETSTTDSGVQSEKNPDTPIQHQSQLNVTPTNHVVSLHEDSMDHQHIPTLCSFYSSHEEGKSDMERVTREVMRHQYTREKNNRSNAQHSVLNEVSDTGNVSQDIVLTTARQERRRQQKMGRERRLRKKDTVAPLSECRMSHHVGVKKTKSIVGSR